MKEPNNTIYREGKGNILRHCHNASDRTDPWVPSYSVCDRCEMIYLYSLVFLVPFCTKQGLEARLHVDPFLPGQLHT